MHTGGVALLLPFFLFTYSLGAAENKLLSDFWGQFYTTPQNLSLSMQKEPPNALKEYLASLYKLPVSPKRVYKHLMPVSLYKSLVASREFFYLYIDTPQVLKTTLLVGGVKKGSVSVNGGKKQQFDLEKNEPLLKLSLALPKGAAYIIVELIERSTGLPVTVLSDKPLPLSKRGFTKNGAASASLSSVKVEGFDIAILDSLYKRFCFPLPEGSPHNAVFERLATATEAEPVAGAGEPVLLELLYRQKADEASRLLLEKLGFTPESLSWWGEMLVAGRMCNDGN